MPSLSFIPPLSFDMRVAMQVSPVTLIFIAMIVFNNMCLQYVEVSFYQVRSLSLSISLSLSLSRVPNCLT